MRYYSKLATTTAMAEKDRTGTVAPVAQALFQPPAHILPPALFYPLYSGKGKPSSIATIFAIWNTMVGSTILTIPWAFMQSGMLMALGIFFIVAGIGYYTCTLIMRWGEGKADFSDVCVEYIGKWTQVVCIILSCMVLIGATIVYHVLMSQTLYAVVDGIIEDEHHPAPSPYWTKGIAALVVLAVMLPILFVRKTTFFVKFNSLGIFFVIFLVIFILCKGILKIVNPAVDPPDKKYVIVDPPLVSLYQDTWAKLCGVLALSFFIHNGVISITRNSQNPDNNKRDLAIAFVLAGLCYLLPGVISLFAFHGTMPDGVEQNFLEQFGKFDVFAFCARVSVFFQLVTVYPLLVLIIRTQLFGYVFKNPWPNMWSIIILNVVVTGITTSFAVFYPFVGTIIRFTGAFCGFFYMYFFPTWTHLSGTSREGRISWWKWAVHGLIVAFGFGTMLLQFFT